MRIGFVAIALAIGCSSQGRTGSADLAGSGMHAGNGAIFLHQRPGQPSGFVADAGAAFRRDTGPAPLLPCTTQMVAGCTARTCTVIMDLGTPPPVELVSAGDVTISGGASALSLTAGADAVYHASSSPTDLWHGGESLSAAVPGDAAPGFTVALMAPDVVTFTAPTGPVMVTSGQDLVLSTSSTDVITVSFSATLDPSLPATTLDVQCPLTAAGGKLTVPGAALALAPKGTPQLLAAAITATNTIDVSGWTMTFTATSSAAFPGQLPTLGWTLQ